MTSRVRITVGAVAAAALTLVAGAWAMPRPPALASTATGDPELIERVRALLAESGGARDRVGVAVIDGDTVKTANFGATGATEYEIGSVTKTMTASVLAELIEAGAVAPDTRLGELLELGSSPAADITLRQLATHTSGLPRLQGGIGAFADTLIAVLRAGDPYPANVDQLVASARTAKREGDRFEYSNFGYALLGQALAARAGTDYPALARERVFAPLGMADTYAPTTPADLRADAPTGFTASGRRSDPWTLAASAPAGSVRSTLDDMVLYVRAQLDGSAPGVAATEPTTDAGDGERIGYAWFTGDGMTWHNGGTGGFTSWIGFDRKSRRAVVVLNNTTASVDELGKALMRP